MKKKTVKALQREVNMVARMKGIKPTKAALRITKKFYLGEGGEVRAKMRG